MKTSTQWWSFVSVPSPVRRPEKLHTGRSRNDQVLTDLHLFIRHRSHRMCPRT
ncbi:MAG: lyase family protein [Marinilabiliales bacterium]|nr:lyase family protein [Marinilabiliales bacterium]